MLESMPSHVWAGWQAYYSIEPFGPPRDDYHAAGIAAAVYNSRRTSSADAMLTKSEMLCFPEPEIEDEEAEAVSAVVKQNQGLHVAELINKAAAAAKERKRLGTM